jgi:hypothetical protein
MVELVAIAWVIALVLIGGIVGIGYWVMTHDDEE